VPATLEVFDTHFPRFPVLPGVLVLADAVQVATLALARRSDREWRLTGVRGVRWRRYVQPGDTIEVGVQIKDDPGERAVFSATIKVGNRVVATIDEIFFAAR
jgi:3-hydroxyacyl-[acyl-carrier-protein] dehydratase